MRRRTPVADAVVERLRSGRRGDGSALLVRFLRSRRGRRWNTVYAELCAELPGGRLGRRAREMVDAVVYARVERHDGELHAADSRGGCVLYSQPGHVWRARFYVDPTDGTLREAPPRPVPEVAAAPSTRIDMGRGVLYLRQGGIWYAAQIARVAPGQIPFDHWLRANATSQNAELRQALYKRCRHYAMYKRQLDRRALRRAGLENAR